VGVLVIHVLVFTLYLYCYVYVYFILTVLFILVQGLLPLSENSIAVSK
jgi:hypothetical protein